MKRKATTRTTKKIQDAGYEGAPFTWSNNRQGNGNTCERIDRALTSFLCIQNFPNTKVSHLPRVGSDHTPLLLNSHPDKQLLQKPFRCIRSWLSHPSISALVANSWTLPSNSDQNNNIYSKLQLLSSDLSQWNSDVYGNIHKNIKSLNNRIDSLHKSGNYSANLEKIKKLQTELGDWYKIKNDYYHQLSRDKFFKEYDQNTEYFHATASNRKRINAIHTLREPSGLWISERDQINSLLINHFSQIGISQIPNYVEDLSNIIDPCISEEENLALTLTPSKQEIWNTISNMNQWGAPGPDGFQPGFF
ncbi:uncharacterized protein LOC113281798 [Papaver somniferum]|uniref:uncharacterized protein LOC113281798 n=1 Tax=Papaver somniferum TaxID=3469 RepID=UPI000E6FBB1F|nr:uncharacterized protein LOC113281798 [Papaver somniferum]XP_026386441.1 uncharacterized protein LOC113281798 [Papaver somniferum]XP_026386442.1 uncharacterized protein LOC113281798 [Papaver somniferum]XP_026386443.1 uncharacterized protein LOC113281798 [Papaver somniferum]XP_026386444.1 uncharacterized protein LOC113281798 [Papaver somniferum]XP_026386445.1 uncharacterized protein LOC113281798 [Papaver somniferum]